jgi:predicted DNA-binding transcriptional regulator AlpA
MENRAKSLPDQLVTKKAVAERLSLSVRSVDRLTAKGVLRRVKVLGAVRFRLSEVLLIMSGGAS